MGGHPRKGSHRRHLWKNHKRDSGITIPRGHKLRLELASVAFTTFSRNLNTGGHNETETDFVKSKQTIYHCKETEELPGGHALPN
ncbi:MAG: hypothetical protein ACE5NG_05685 [bacterium]